MKFVLTNLLTVSSKASSNLVKKQNNKENVIKRDTANGTKSHSMRNQVKLQIPVLINPARTILRLKFNSVKDSPTLTLVSKMAASGTYQLPLLQPRDQIHVLTKNQIPRTLSRLLCALPSPTLTLANKMVASGTYQLPLLQQLLQAPVLTLPLMLRTLSRLLCALPSPTLLPVNKMAASGTYQLPLLQPRDQIPVLTKMEIPRTLRRLLFA
jgi:hypothetical protein